MRARIDRLGAEAREAWGCSAPMSPRRSRASPTSSPSRRSPAAARGFMETVRGYQHDRACACLSRSVLADRAARNPDRARRPRRRDGRAPGCRRPAARRDHPALADPAGARLVPADLGDRPGQPPARRHDRRDPAASMRSIEQPAVRDGPRARRRRQAVGDPLRGCQLRLSRPAAAGARPTSRSTSPPARPSRSSARRAPARRRRQSAAAVLGPGGGPHPDDGVDLRGLRARPSAPPHLAGVAGHLSLQRHAARQRPARPARRR